MGKIVSEQITNEINYEFLSAQTLTYEIDKNEINYNVTTSQVGIVAEQLSNELDYEVSFYGFLVDHDHVCEITTGLINGTNTEFIFSQQFVGRSVRLFMNGLQLQYNIDYQERVQSNKVIFTTAPESGDVVWGIYLKSTM